MKRRIVTLILLPLLALAMMASTSECTFGSKGQVPQSAEHDPKPLNTGKYSEKPTDKQFLFRLKFSTDRKDHAVARYSYYFGSQGDEDLIWEDDVWLTEKRVSPGTILSLRVTTDRKTILHCEITYIHHKKTDERLRAIFFENEPQECDLHYVVLNNEPQIEGL